MKKLLLLLILITIVASVILPTAVSAHELDAIIGPSTQTEEWRYDLVLKKTISRIFFVGPVSFTMEAQANAVCPGHPMARMHYGVLNRAMRPGYPIILNEYIIDNVKTQISTEVYDHVGKLNL